ncbi:MAG: hypothetical protein ACR2P1_27850 [Pseudomonadales bacterium]
MIISHKYKFIFIKTVKTAGTSIEVFLSQQCSDHDIVTPIIPHVDPHIARNYRGLWNPVPDIMAGEGRGVRRDLRDLVRLRKYYNHIPARVLKNRVSSKVWNEYYKFCVERNPWDKTLSHYHMMNDIADTKISLDQYLAKGDFCLNLPKYTDSNDTLMVDRVVKYEKLDEELGEVFELLKVPYSGSLDVKAKSEHRTDKKSYKDVLNESQRKIVADIFKKEMNMHGYAY